MRTVVIGLIAIGVSLATVLGGVAVQAGAWPAGADAVGFAAATAAVGIVLIGVLYWPVLARVRRRSAVLSRGRAAVLTGLILNAPVYVGLAVAGNTRSLFAGGEAFLIGLGLAVLGFVFGAGYASTHRDAAA